MNAIVQRDTIEDIVAKRNKALTLYGKAYDSWEEAAAAMKAATEASKIAAPGSRFNYHLEHDSREMFSVVNTPKRDAFTAHMRKITDTDCWSHVLSLTNLERLMDRQAKDELHRQLIDDPPEITVDNIHATLEQFMLDADTIWKRGIAKCFSALDRRFKTHDGWKIGHRIILTYAFNDWGSFTHGHTRDTIIDVERTFLVLDGRPREAMYAGIVEVIQRERGYSGGARQSEHEGEFFKIRCFKNGNAHLWFTRDDLVERVNKLLGEYYDAPIPHEREADKDDGMAPKTSLAKNLGWYPTPPAAASEVIDVAPLYRRKGEPALTVLEPSAGSGNLARLCLDKGAIVDCVEIHAHRARELRDDNRYRKVTTSDFMLLKPDPANLYDRVVMNPPFDRERDIDHVWHALKFLKPDGCLVAIMSASSQFRETKKSITFRSEIDKLNGIWRDLPPGSFASVGTYCNTVILKVRIDGQRCWW